MAPKQRYTLGVIVGLAFCAVGACCAIFGMHSKFLVTLGLALCIVGAFIGRRSLRGFICIAVFNKAKNKELEKLEAIFAGGGISQEEYYARKIQLLNAEYDG